MIMTPKDILNGKNLDIKKHKFVVTINSVGEML